MVCVCVCGMSSIASTRLYIGSYITDPQIVQDDLDKCPLFSWPEAICVRTLQPWVPSSHTVQQLLVDRCRENPHT